MAHSRVYRRYNYKHVRKFDRIAATGNGSRHCWNERDTYCYRVSVSRSNCQTCTDEHTYALIFTCSYSNPDFEWSRWSTYARAGRTNTSPYFSYPSSWHADSDTNRRDDADSDTNRRNDANRDTNCRNDDRIDSNAQSCSY